MLFQTIASFIKEDKAGASVEYLILTGAISSVVLAATQEYTDYLTGLFNYISKALNDLNLANLA